MGRSHSAETAFSSQVFKFPIHFVVMVDVTGVDKRLQSHFFKGSNGRLAVWKKVRVLGRKLVDSSKSRLFPKYLVELKGGKKRFWLPSSRLRSFPIIPCNLCGSQENLQRKKIKAMLQDWDKQSPGRVLNVFKSLSRITASHLFDGDLFDFKSLSLEDGDSLTELDIAFDESPLEMLVNRDSLNAQN